MLRYKSNDPLRVLPVSTLFTTGAQSAQLFDTHILRHRSAKYAYLWLVVIEPQQYCD